MVRFLKKSSGLGVMRHLIALNISRGKVDMMSAMVMASRPASFDSASCNATAQSNWYEQAIK